MAMSDWLVPGLVVGGLLLAAVGYLFAATRLRSQLTELRGQLGKEQELSRTQQDHLGSQLQEREQQLSALRPLESQLSAEQARTEALQKALEDATAEREQLRAAAEGLRQEVTRLTARHEQQEQVITEQKDFVKKSSDALQQQFENLANRVFEQKGKQFAEASQTSLNGMLTPLKEQIAGFQRRVNEVHDASTKSHSSLHEAITGVKDMGLKIGQEASNLTTALKGNSQQRGAWGEAQLQRTLEISGLVEGDHYTTQDSFTDDTGKTKRTDFIVRLPEGRQLIIDSKVTLNAYERAVAADSPELHEQAMAEHINAIRKHIDDLASKDYTKLSGLKSPSYVLMFMPMESAYIEALKRNPELFQEGFNQQVVLVSHTTLIPILRTVANLWMLERSNAEAREISDMAADIYNKVAGVAENLRSLGGSLSTVGNHFNKTVVALAGKQGLFGKVEKFEKVSTRISKTLPELEPRDLEIDTSRLDLLVEPMDGLKQLPEGSSEVGESAGPALAEDDGPAGDESRAPDE